MIITLKRFSYGRHETEGVLEVAGRTFATIEQPWLPNPNGSKGGKPFKSCVPDGIYTLVPFTRPNSGDEVYMLYCPALGVYKYPQDHEPGSGRNLCLIHLANWVRQIEGCIAPGLVRLPMVDRKGEYDFPIQAVSSSGAALSAIRYLLGDSEHFLVISNDCGARDE